MYISEQFTKDFISKELSRKDTLWKINTLKAEKKFSIDLGSHQKLNKFRPFIVLKVNYENDSVCVVFFSSQNFYANQISFNLLDNCTNQCKFPLLNNVYVYNNHNGVYSLSKNYFDYGLVKYCGDCKNVDYLNAKLKSKVDNCK